MRTENRCIALGPAVRNTASPEYEAHYAGSHGVSPANPLKKFGQGHLVKYLALLYCHFFAQTISYEDISVEGIGESIASWASQGDLAEYQLSQSEYDRSHKIGIDFENELIEAVRNGDVEAVKTLMGGFLPDVGSIGEMADENRRQMEYLAVSLLTLLTRAAIEGGLRSETAYELGDVYMNRLAAASVRGESFAALGLRATYEFADRVRLANEERRSQSHVEACKDYVAKNLRKDIRVGDIAPAIGLSRTYLSHLFRKTEGLTLQQYIQREKCRHAANLLQYSDYPIAMIAEYFGFSSQSYFGVCFQSWYNMTPSEYRRVHFQNLRT